jgi:hypothetical protein
LLSRLDIEKSSQGTLTNPCQGSFTNSLYLKLIASFIMGCLGKGLALVLILTMTISSLSLLTVKPANAQTIPKPSVPQFTIETISSPYDVSPTHSIDPYTGQSTTIPSYHVENKTTEIKITNQPFTPYQTTIGDTNWTINLYYNIRLKGHFYSRLELLSVP